jgi:hypothetical protein
MKTISKALKLCIVALSLLPLATNAQEASKSGFVRLANAVAPGTGPLHVLIDGKKINPKGYKIGDLTGGINLSPGNHNVTFTREGVKEGSTRVSVEPNETTTLIPFAEKVPASEQVPAHWAIRILRLKQKDPEDERSATFTSVSEKPEVNVEIREPKGKWNTVHVKRLTIAQAPILYPRGYVPLRSTEGDLTSIPVSSAGNYVILLYDDEQGKLRSLNFRDKKFLSAD